MSYPDKQICRLCLDITPSCECEAIDEIKKKILEVLLINIDLAISGDVVACNKCIESLQNFNDFKSHCIVTCTNPVNKICLESSQICRICLSIIEVKTLNRTTGPDLNAEISLKEIIEHCLPEVEFDAVRDPFLCNPCQNSMKKYYEFMKNCEKVEQQIHNYCQLERDGTAGRINLQDMLKFREHKMLEVPSNIKKECPNAECNDANVKNEETTIKCEEIHIKDEELDDGVELGAADKLVAHVSFGKNGSSKPKLMVKSSKGIMHFCPKCPYFAKRIYHIKDSTSFDSGNGTCKCSLCPMLTTTGLSQDGHKGPTKTFGCCECSYETDHKYNLKKHLFTHECKLEIQMYKCSMCKFETKSKLSLRKHMRTHGVTYALITLKCNECTYQCTEKSSLKKHRAEHFKLDKLREELGVADQLVDHDLPDNNGSVRQRLMVELLNEKKHLCPKCPYFNKKFLVAGHMSFDSDKTTCKCFLCPLLTAAGLSQEHVPSHKGPTKIYRCCECSYETDFKHRIERHYIKHGSILEVHVYKCANCAFETKHKGCLIRHTKIHEGPTVPKKYKCEQCSYLCIGRYRLKKHMLIHSDEVKTFKCDECSYRSIRRCDLKRHMVRHINLHQYSCNQCTYSTNVKCSLLRHYHSNHTESQSLKELLQCLQSNSPTKTSNSLYSHKETRDPTAQKFKCKQCDYSTYLESRVNRHMLTHTVLGETVVYYCATCDFKTKHKDSLRRHMKICLKKKSPD